jgi:hypothetical protein
VIASSNTRCLALPFALTMYSPSETRARLLLFVPVPSPLIGPPSAKPENRLPTPPLPRRMEQLVPIDWSRLLDEITRAGR